MDDLSKPLSPQELDELDQALLDRFDEDLVEPQGDERIFDVSSLDGFLTAVLSSPVMIMPSRWLPAVWGDYPPDVEGAKAFDRMFSLMIRHSNEIAGLLTNDPDGFEPLFLEGEDEEGTYLIVDEWCEGFMRGIELIEAQGVSVDDEVEDLLYPVWAFTHASNWTGYDVAHLAQTEELQLSIAPNVIALHEYWFERRKGPVRPSNEPFHQDSPPVGRNDPCPCGSGKKFKKCCLH